MDTAGPSGHESPSRDENGRCTAPPTCGTLDVVETSSPSRQPPRSGWRRWSGFGHQSLRFGRADTDLLVGPSPGLGGLEVSLRPGLGDPRLHLRLGARDRGVSLGLDLLEPGPLLVDQALLAVLLGELYRDLLGLQDFSYAST